MENLLIIILSVVFSIVSVVAIILVVILMTKPVKKEEIPSNPNLKYCNLDILNIGNYSIGVGKDNEQLIIQSALSSNPRIVFNLMNRNRPLMQAIGEENRFLYTYLNQYTIQSHIKTSSELNNESNSLCKFQDVTNLDNFRINDFTCNQRSVGSLTFANGIKLETVDNILVIYGKSGRFEFNNNKSIFKITNTQQNSDNKDNYLFFDGKSLCSEPKQTSNSCIGTQATEDTEDVSIKTEEMSSTDVDGITFSNGYIIYTLKDNLIIKGKTATVNFNLNGGSDLFTLNDTLTQNYFYYNYKNQFGIKSINDPNPPKCYSNVGEIKFNDGSVYTGKNMTGVQNITGLQSLEFQNKMKLKGDDTSIRVNIEDVPKEKKRDKSPPDLATFNIVGGDGFTASAKNGHYFFVNPDKYGSKSLTFKEDINKKN